MKTGSTIKAEYYKLIDARVAELDDLGLRVEHMTPHLGISRPTIYDALVRLKRHGWKCGACGAVPGAGNDSVRPIPGTNTHLCLGCTRGFLAVVLSDLNDAHIESAMKDFLHRRQAIEMEPVTR